LKAECDRQGHTGNTDFDYATGAIFVGDKRVARRKADGGGQYSMEWSYPDLQRAGLNVESWAASWRTAAES
jgi:hypothetical protein